MPRLISTILQAWADRRRARRRQANLRAGARARPVMTLVPSRSDATAGPGADARDASAAAAGSLISGSSGRRRIDGRRAIWVAVAGLSVALGGGALIAGHARHLAAATASTPQAAANVRAANAYQAILPGVSFGVPAQPGFTASIHPGGALLVAAGMQASPPVRVDLCSQMRSPTDTRLLPLRLGYRFDDVKRWVARNQESNVQIALRNVLLVADRSAGAGADRRHGPRRFHRSAQRTAATELA
jgi:hypothetical protein